MSEKMGVAVAGVLFFAVACVSTLAGQTPKNPIDTRPEGGTPNCTYSGSVTDGKPSGSSQCAPGVLPGTDPNQIPPVGATKRFPFPGETPAAAAVPTPQTNAPQANPAVPTGSSAVERFPFPVEAPNLAERGGGTPAGSGPPVSPGPPLQDAGSSGASSGSTSSSHTDPDFSSSNHDDEGGALPDDNPNAPLPTPRHNARKKMAPVKKPLTTDEQEAEDVQIAGFYQNDGNYKAAYDRAKEAVNLSADDPDAHLALADAARKLGKLDEAGTNYRKTLSLDPVPRTRKAAEKALKEMSGS